MFGGHHAQLAAAKRGCVDSPEGQYHLLEDPQLLDHARRGFAGSRGRATAEGSDVCQRGFRPAVQVSIGRCISDLEVITKAGLPQELVNQVLYLPS
jgi:hypothetical protein